MDGAENKKSTTRQACMIDCASIPSLQDQSTLLEKESFLSSHDSEVNPVYYSSSPSTTEMNDRRQHTCFWEEKIKVIFRKCTTGHWSDKQL